MMNSGIQETMENTRFVRWQQGAKETNLGRSTFDRLAIRANAKYKVGRAALYDMEKIIKYIKSGRS